MQVADSFAFAFEYEIVVPILEIVKKKCVEPLLARTSSPERYPSENRPRIAGMGFKIDCVDSPFA